MSDDTQQAGRVSIAATTWGKDATLGRQGVFRWSPGEEHPEPVREGDQWQGEPHEACAITVDVGPLAPADAAPVEPPALDCRPCGTVTFGGDGGEFDVGVGVHCRIHIGKRTP